MSESEKKFRVNVDYKSGGVHDFPDVTRVEINLSRMLFIDYSNGTRYTEDFRKVERIRITTEKEDVPEEVKILETHEAVMIAEKKRETGMMDLEEFAELIKQAYANLGLKSMAPIKEIWQAFHLLNITFSQKVTLAEFKILLKQLHDLDFHKYVMARGSSVFPENKRYGIVSDRGLLCYFRLNEKKSD